MMRHETRSMLWSVVSASTLALCAVLPSAAAAQTVKTTTDWGGGYSIGGPDSASVTIATSGGGTATAAPLVVPVAPSDGIMIDWGGGYLRGPDSASTTIATSGAGTPRPNN